MLIGLVSLAAPNGVIQHDLNPANFEVTPEGNVKVLDWGAELERLAPTRVSR